MKWSTIARFKAVRGLLFAAAIAAAIVYKLITQGFTQENILIVALGAAVCALVAVIVRVVRARESGGRGAAE